MQPGDDMRITCAPAAVLLMGMSAGLATHLDATIADPADDSIRQFLAQDDTQRPYRATRRLEAANGTRAGWLEAATEYSPETGFRYQVTAEGGSDYIRSKVLHAVLEGEHEAIARGEMSRSSLGRANYTFQSRGIDESGLAHVILSPRRKERILVAGTMFLEPKDGRLVRLQGQLSKSPSIWINKVDIVRSYDRIEGVVVPIALDSTAQVRFLGQATFHMTYVYSEIDGRTIKASSTR
jgi:hypothetical protein